MGKGVAYGFFLLVVQITPDVLFGDAGAFFFPAFLEGVQFLFVAAGADEGLLSAFFQKLHLFMAVRAAGIA